MMPAQVLSTAVADLLVRHPAAARVFVSHGMGCVGCAFAQFETVNEAAVAYGLDPERLARRIASVTRSQEE